jgi:hypothetical protein
MTNDPQQLDPRLRSLLSGLRWRIRAYVWLEGLALALIWLGLTFWAGLALDYLPVWAGASEMPVAARAVVLAIICGGLLAVLYRWVVRRAFVPLANRSMAVLLERQFGVFRDSLVTSVELTEQPDHAGAFDPSMLVHTNQEALTEVDRVRLGAVFNYRPLFGSLLGAAILLGTILLFYTLNQQALAVWVHRIYLLRDEAWPRNALIEVVGVELLGPEDASLAAGDVPLIPFRDGRLKAAKGSNLRLRVRAALKAKVVPETCTIHYRTADGERGRVTMSRLKRSQDGYQQYTFSGKPLQGILTTVQFDVVGHDYRVRDYTIEAVDSPTIVGVKLDCKFPAYMVDEQLGAWTPRTVDWTSSTQLPRGTEVTIRAHTNKPLKRVDLYHPDTQETEQLDCTGAADPQQFEVPAGHLDANLTLDVTLFDADDVVTERPYRIFIAAIPDEAPRVDVRLKGSWTTTVSAGPGSTRSSRTRPWRRTNRRISCWSGTSRWPRAAKSTPRSTCANCDRRRTRSNWSRRTSCRWQSARKTSTPWTRVPMSAAVTATNWTSSPPKRCWRCSKPAKSDCGAVSSRLSRK